MRNVTKKTKGVTLIELVVAMAVLMVITAPILGVFEMSTRISAGSYKQTIATFTAQLRMEELVGLTEDEIFDNISTPIGTPYPVSSGLVTYNGYPVKVDIDSFAIDSTNYDNLRKATVTVFDKDNTTVLCTQQNTLNITPGGV